MPRALANLDSSDDLSPAVRARFIKAEFDRFSTNDYENKSVLLKILMMHLCLLHTGRFIVNLESTIARRHQIASTDSRTRRIKLHWANAIRREVAGM
jgi:hypothetical protein